MYCKHCGAEIADDAIFCSQCGTKQIEDKPVPPAAPRLLPFFHHDPVTVHAQGNQPGKRRAEDDDQQTAEHDLRPAGRGVIPQTDINQPDDNA